MPLELLHSERAAIFYLLFAHTSTTERKKKHKNIAQDMKIHAKERI